MHSIIGCHNGDIYHCWLFYKKNLNFCRRTKQAAAKTAISRTLKIRLTEGKLESRRKLFRLVCSGMWRMRLQTSRHIYVKRHRFHYMLFIKRYLQQCNASTDVCFRYIKSHMQMFKSMFPLRENDDSLWTFSNRHWPFTTQVAPSHVASWGRNLSASTSYKKATSFQVKAFIAFQCITFDMPRKHWKTNPALEMLALGWRLLTTNWIVLLYGRVNVWVHWQLHESTHGTGVQGGGVCKKYGTEGSKKRLALIELPTTMAKFRK